MLWRRGESLVPSRNRTPVLQPSAWRCADWVIPACSAISRVKNNFTHRCFYLFLTVCNNCIISLWTVVSSYLLIDSNIWFYVTLLYTLYNMLRVYICTVHCTVELLHNIFGVSGSNYGVENSVYWSVYLVLLFILNVICHIANTPCFLSMKFVFCGLILHRVCLLYMHVLLFLVSM
jgi:hypothetical protein